MDVGVAAAAMVVETAEATEDAVVDVAAAIRKLKLLILTPFLHSKTI